MNGETNGRQKEVCEEKKELYIGQVVSEIMKLTRWSYRQAEFLKDWKGFRSHRQCVEDIQNTQSRKRAFWSQM